MTLATNPHHAEIILDTDDTCDACNGGMMLGTTADRLAGLRDGALAHKPTPPPRSGQRTRPT